ncbi:hypothetical protein O6H91_01G131400 [Diphasiastrum complanatum]|uniref:Uncharacterized protein n=1 Tax=Diphasiastrum complanatum TaxID=34168 RepID=A0ACC2EWC4_DIPCM|nr:hypothetical protein O6H91_01G131400 [Diphasiastrum complanatum]
MTTCFLIRLVVLLLAVARQSYMLCVLPWISIQIGLSFKWMLKNAFNSVSQGAIFQELRAAHGPLAQLIPFVRSFYSMDAPLYFSHASRSGDVLVIPSADGIRQGDPLGGVLFSLVHFRALRAFSAAFPSCLFPSIADYTHIVGPANDVFPAFLHFSQQLSALGLIENPSKCVAWCPQGLLPGLPLPTGFNTPADGIRALGIPIGFSDFVASSLRDTLGVHLRHADLLPKLGNAQVALGILTQCFTQRPSYILRCVPPSPDVLALLQDFDNALSDILRRLMGSESFRIPHGQFVKRQVSLPASSGGVGLTCTTSIAPAAFMGSWALVASALISRFQQDNKPILLDSVAHVETCILPFQQHLRAAKDLIPPSFFASL